MQGRNGDCRGHTRAVHHQPKPPKTGVKLTNMQDDDAKSDKRGVRLPKLYALVTATGENDEKRPATVRECMKELAKDSYCCQASFTVGAPELTYKFERNGFLTAVAPIDKAVQKVIYTSLRVQFLYLTHYPPLAGNEGEDVCTIRQEGSIIGRLRPMTYTRQ